jgi:transposase
MNCRKCKLENKEGIINFDSFQRKRKNEIVVPSSAVINDGVVNHNGSGKTRDDHFPLKNINGIDTFLGVDVGKFFIDVYCSLNEKYYLRVKNEEKSITKLIKTIRKDLNLDASGDSRNKRKNNNKNNNNNKMEDGNKNNKINRKSNVTDESNDINKNRSDRDIDNVLVVIDLTGDYEVLCRDLFYSNGFTNIHLADGKKIKYFRKSKGNSIAKTDKSDAFILALYGRENLNNIVLYADDNGDNNKKELGELQKIELRIDDLKHFLVKEKNRLQAPNIPKLIKKDIEQTIEYLESKIDKLQKEAKKIIENNESLNKKYNILIKQRGIGDITARTLLSFLPELGTINKNKISSLSGTAPIARDSGTLKGYRTTKGNGRKTIKQTLFMSVLSTIRKKDSLLNIFYNSLLKKGKGKMIAMVACMRKLVIYLNSLMKKEYYLEMMN